MTIPIHLILIDWILIRSMWIHWNLIRWIGLSDSMRSLIRLMIGCSSSMARSAKPSDLTRLMIRSIVTNQNWMSGLSRLNLNGTNLNRTSSRDSMSLNRMIPMNSNPMNSTDLRSLIRN